MDSVKYLSHSGEKVDEYMEYKYQCSLTSDGASSIVSRDPGQCDRGGCGFGHCEARLVRRY